MMEAVDEVGKGLSVEGRKWLRFGVVVGFFLGDGWTWGRPQAVVLFFFYVVLFDEGTVKLGEGTDVVALVRSVFFIYFILCFSVSFAVILSFMRRSGAKK